MRGILSPPHFDKHRDKRLGHIQSRQYVSCPAGGEPEATPESTPRLPADRSERFVKNDPSAQADPKGTSGKYLSENPLVVSGIALTRTAYIDTPASSEQSAASLNGRGEIPVTLSYQAAAVRITIMLSDVV